MDEPLTLHQFRSPRGQSVQMWLRDGTTDYNTAFSCLDADEYALKDVYLGMDTAIDIGAHIGGVAIALAVDNPAAHVIAVEALSANVEMIHKNADANHIGPERLTIIHGGAAGPDDKAVEVAWDHGAMDGTNETAIHHRYIGNARNVGSEMDHQVETLPPVTLSHLVTGRTVKLLKIDCELCEYDAFKDADGLRQVPEIRGEYHDGFQRLVELLPDHDVVDLGDGHLGGFVAVRRG